MSSGIYVLRDGGTIGLVARGRSPQMLRGARTAIRRLLGGGPTKGSHMPPSGPTPTAGRPGERWQALDDLQKTVGRFFAKFQELRLPQSRTSLPELAGLRGEADRALDRYKKSVVVRLPELSFDATGVLRIKRWIERGRRETLIVTCRFETVSARGKVQADQPTPMSFAEHQDYVREYEEITALLRYVRRQRQEVLNHNDKLPPAGAGDGAGKQTAPEATATTSASRDAKLPKLRPHDRQAYQLWTLHGWKQQRIADELNKEHGTTYKQGGVSRMIKRVKRHAEASGLANHIPDPAKPAKAIDPGRLEIGRRTDRRTPSQRAKRNADDE